MIRAGILGTQNSGKTVLLTVLSQLYRRQRGRYRLVPLTQETYQFTARNWEKIRKSDWPASTSGDQLTRLNWEFQVDSTPYCNFLCRDISGQQFRQIFSKSSDVSNCLPHEVPLRDFIQNSDLLAILINLSDFIEGSEDSKKISEIALANAITFTLNSIGVKSCVLVFSKIDKYADFLNDNFSRTRTSGIKQKLMHYLKDAAPKLHEVIVANQLTILPVSAVANPRHQPNATTPPIHVDNDWQDDDADYGDEPPDRNSHVPSSHWRSIGLNPLLLWFEKSARRLRKERLQDPEQSVFANWTAAPFTTPAPPPSPAKQAENSRQPEPLKVVQPYAPPATIETPSRWAVEEPQATGKTKRFFTSRQIFYGSFFGGILTQGFLLAYNLHQAGRAGGMFVCIILHFLVAAGLIAVSFLIPETLEIERAVGSMSVPLILAFLASAYAERTFPRRDSILKNPSMQLSTWYVTGIVVAGLAFVFVSVIIIAISIEIAMRP